MTVRVLRAVDRVATPWKNGGGIARDIAIDPPGAGTDAFRWRASLADITRDGPFSAYPGVERVFVLLEGTVTLRFADRPPLDLTPASEPIRFPGEAAVHAALRTDRALVLNLMTRGGRGELRRLTAFGRIGPGLVVVAAGEVHVGGQALGPLDAAVLDGSAEASAPADARAWLATFTAA